MNKQQQMQDLLKDTVDYYSKDPSGRRCLTDDGDCMYTWGNRHCAVGRFLKTEYQDETWESNNESVEQLADKADDSDYSIDQFLVEKTHGLDADFWIDLQEMHDIMSYWEEWDLHVDGKRKYGLTDLGKEAYVRFQDKIAGGEYDD